MATGSGTGSGASGGAEPMGMGRMGLRLIAGMGLFLCILTGWLAARSALGLLKAPATPLHATVAAAPDRAWVELDDAVLDCATQQVRERTALVLADDRAGLHPFVAELSGKDACARLGQRPLDGAFVGSFSRDFLRERQGLPLPPGADLRVFSQSQSPRLLKRALGWRVVWFGLSVLLTLLAVRANWNAQSALERRVAEKIGRRPRRG